MRVTSNAQSQLAILNIQNTFAKMSKLQNQISTGNDVNSVSDNPLNALQIIQNNAAGAQLTTNLSSIQSASNVLQSSSDALTQIQNILATIKNSALTANNPNQTVSNTALAAQVNSAINQIVGVANTQLSDGTYLFSGTASKTPPYATTASSTSGQVSAITYQGSQQTGQMIVGKSLSVNTLLVGSSIFQPVIGGATVYSGSTGAQAGAGTDTPTGHGALLVQHTLTSFSGSSGIAAGTSSDASDTILGPLGANKLVINDTSGTGASGTVSLNGGTPVAFTNSDGNLKVTGPAGEVVYLDTTAISAGFKGSVDLTADGTMSVDGGTSTTPIDFSTNQAVTDFSNGATTYVNSSNIRQAGTAQVTYPGKTDLFQTLMNLRDTIANTQGQSSSDRSAALNQQIAELDRFSNSIAVPLSNQATQSQFLTNLQTRTTTLQLNLKKATSDLQSTDMAASIVALQQEQVLYQAGMQMTATISQLSLVNFIK
ncbi:flagellar hook-associated protein FlgL [Schlesneria paludicola]|uniref:flagellar hook-associated protein FlgL n=1 Tax=Schlesneria paludicola TaxID=360056 RepID=UPI00029ACC77|nr:flagellar hook-associated protein FlgL [Schlesneria paludicola]